MSRQPYTKYKDSGAEWLSEVPSHWGLVPVKHLVRFFSGGTPSKENEDYWEGEIPWASAKDMKVDVLSDTEDHITDFAIEQGAATLLDRGTVLIVVRGMILARTFPVCLTRAPMAINQDLKGLVAGPRIVPGFLAWYLRGTADESLRRLDEAGHGTKALRMDAWSSLPVALPPLPEQALVVAFLDRETARIDALIAEQERLIALVKEKRQSVISHAVTKGLNPTVTMKDSGIEWLGEVPEHWNVARVKNVTSHVVDCLHTTPTYDGELEFPCVRTADVEPGKLLLQQARLVSREVYEERIKRLKPISGDILYSREGERFGIAALVPKDVDLCLGQRMMMFRASIDTDGAYLMWAMNSNAILRQVEIVTGGATSPHINISDIVNFTVPFPPLAEQTAIVTYIDTETAKLDALVAEAERAIDLLREHRAALISAAVTGKIDVRGLVEAEAA